MQANILFYVFIVPNLEELLRCESLYFGEYTSFSLLEILDYHSRMQTLD